LTPNTTASPLYILASKETPEKDMAANTVEAPLSPMEYRQLGRSGLKVSAISLGGWYVPMYFLLTIQ
jgi:hypothetical protein